MRNRMGFIPSLFTVLNLFCGFMSIIHADAGNFSQACLFILYAGLFDIFDGVVARFTGTSSKFGVELDSLADLVSFGVAPSIILYKAFFISLDGLGIALSALIMIFGALRLARFNANLIGFDKNFFIGVPIPIPAVTVSSYFLFYFNKNFSPGLSEIFVYSLAIGLPLLMVSTFKYDTTPKFSVRELKERPVKSVIVILSIILVLITRGEGLFAFCLFYLSTGIFRSTRNQMKKFFGGKKRPDEEETEENLKLK
ncbi:MAG: CDP-diacylglycerol--serine O-phosphatidyltransferase, partial [Ignavibacteria bacterium]|nr:CDP-diacylglycerol--serine O-phosphatidyltransferase [Ignavibacteria bacterium]